MTVKIIISRSVLEELRFLSSVTKYKEHGMFILGFQCTDNVDCIELVDVIYTLNISSEPEKYLSIHPEDIEYVHHLLFECQIDVLTFAHSHPVSPFFSSNDIEGMYRRKSSYYSVYKDSSFSFVKYKNYLCFLAPEIIVTARPYQFIVFLAPTKFKLVFNLGYDRTVEVDSISISEFKKINSALKEGIENIEYKLSSEALGFFRRCHVIYLSLRWIW